MVITDMGILYWFIIALMAIPPPLLLCSWYLSYKTHSKNIVTWVVLAVATASYSLLIAEVWFPETWGEYRSNRLATISVNVALSILSLLAIAVYRPEARTLLLSAALIVLIALWLIATMINAVV